MPTYQAAYHDMQSVNAKDVVITSIVKDTLNKSVSFNELSKGRMSIVKFWATWCTPCIATMPDFVKLKEQYNGNRNIQFITVSLDELFDDWQKTITQKNWAIDHYWEGADEKSQMYQLTYEVMDDMVLVVLPNYVVTDEKGRVYENIKRDSSSNAALENILKKIAN